MYEYVGAIHIHSVFSDGSGEIDEIAFYAEEVGLDFIIITDHNTLRGLNDGYEKYFGKTLVLIGCEINDKDNLNHLLAFGIKETVSTRIPAKEYVQKVKELGGISFIAHPNEKRSSMKEHPAYPWKEWDSDDFTGIEIWNHMSEWMEGLTEQNKYNYFVHPLRSIEAPTEETLKLWDDLNKNRKVVGIGGVDAHAHKVNLLGFFEVEVFPYKVLFKSVRTHVITESKLEVSKSADVVNKNKELIYKALAEGNSFVSNYYHGDAAGFRFFAESNKKIFYMGQTVELKENKVKLRVLLPNVSGTIRLIKDGLLLDTVDSYDADFLVSEAGIYRIEVYLDDKAWIFSNHIRLGV